jgi:hypothetical protein
MTKIQPKNNVETTYVVCLLGLALIYKYCTVPWICRLINWKDYKFRQFHSGVRVARSLYFCIVFCRFFFLFFSFGHCIVFPSINGFWIPLQFGYTTCFQRCVNVANSTKVQHWQTLLKSTYFQRCVNVINQPYLNGEHLTSFD